MPLFQPKFNIGDIVCIDDDFHHNPGYKTLSIGKIIAIHIHRGKGFFKGEDNRGRVLYTISGFSLMPKEEDLMLYEEKK